MNAQTLTELGFSAAYTAASLLGLPGSGPEALQFHALHESAFREGLVVRVVPNGASPWVGNFRGGDGTHNGVYATPLREEVCIVARGRGYVVDVQRPQAFRILEAYPVIDVRGLPDLALLIFATYTDVMAYGPERAMRWRARTSWDGLQLRRVSAQGIEGVGWDSVADREVGFFIDPCSGTVEGGAAPPL